MNWHGLLTSLMFLRNSWLMLRNHGRYCNQLRRIRRFRKSDLLFAGQNFTGICFPYLCIWGSAVLGPVIVTCLVSRAAEHSGEHTGSCGRLMETETGEGTWYHSSCECWVYRWATWRATELSSFCGLTVVACEILWTGVPLWINKTQPKEDLLLPLLHRHLRTWSNVHKYTVLGQVRTRNCCKIRSRVVNLDSLKVNLSKLKLKMGNF